MVEGQGPDVVPRIGDDGRPGVVGPLRHARSPGQENRRDGVEARIARRVGVGAELADELDIERGLLAGLSDGGGFERFAVIDEASRQRPTGRRIPPFDEDDAPDPPPGHDLDDDVDRRDGITVLAAGHFRAAFIAILGGPLPACQPGVDVFILAPTSSIGDGFMTGRPGSQAGPLARNLLIYG